MDVTDQVRSTITQSLRRKGMKKSDLAQEMKMGKSWVTKLLNGTIKSLSDSQTDKLEEVLDLEFVVGVRKDDIPAMARILGERMKEDEKLAELLTALVSMTDENLYYDLPHIPTKDLVDFGKEIMRAAHEDPEKPGKVGKIALVWLSERLRELKP